MKRTIKILLISIILVTMFILTGCSTRSSKSFTFEVETGDSIKVKLDTSEGYDIDSDLPFTISKDDEKISEGTFLTEDGYEQYIEAIEEDSDAEIIDTGSKNGVEYTFYSYKDEYFNYVIKIDDSDTGVLLSNEESEESAKKCFKRLTFTKE